MKTKKSVLRRAMTMMLVVIMLVLNTVPAYASNFNKNYSLSGNSAEKMISVATAQLGRTKGEMGYYDSWCARFVSDVASIVGESTAIPYNAGCRQLYNAIKNAGGKDVSTPQKGDIVFFVCTACKVSGYNNAFSHVGIMMDGSGMCISGNYSGRVTKHSVNSYANEPHSVSSGVVTLKYVRPNYSNSSSGSGSPISHSITLSSSSAYLEVGKTTSIAATITTSGSANLNFEVSNGSICSVSWQSSSCIRTSDTTWTNTLKLTGVSAGSSTLTLKLTDANTGAIRATKTLSITVAPPPNVNPTVTFSKDSLSVEEGKTATVSASIQWGSATSGKYGVNNSSVATVSGEGDGKTWNMTVKGQSAGSTELYINMYNSSGKALLTKTIPVTVTSVAKPSVSVNPSSVTVTAGGTAKVTVDFQLNGAKEAVFRVEDPNICSASWSNQNTANNQRVLTIAGKSAGSTGVVVDLRDSAGQTVASQRIAVTVNPKPQPIEEPLELNVSTDAVILDLNGTAAQSSHTTTISWTGTVPEGSKVSVVSSSASGYDSNAVSLSWGNKTSSSRGLIITGNQEGHSLLEIAIKDKSGTVLASKTVEVTVVRSNNISLSLSKSSISMRFDETADIIVSYRGGNLAWGYDKDCPVEVNMSSADTGSMTLCLSPRAVGTGICTFSVIESNTSKTLATETLTVTVTNSIADKITAFSLQSVYAAANTKLEDEIESSSVKQPQGSGQALMTGFSATGSTELSAQSADISKGTPSVSNLDVSSTPGAMVETSSGTASVGISGINESSRFTDIDSEEYYFEPILWAQDTNVTAGVTGTTLDPNGNCPRGQVIEFLWRALGSPEPKSTNNPFTDVSSSDSYYKAVLWAYENDVTNGTSADVFSPNDTCTRGQVMTFLWRAKDKPAASGGNLFTDVEEGEYYEVAVNWAVEESITNGTSTTTFSPHATCTRAQILTFLYRCVFEETPEKT